MKLPLPIDAYDLRARLFPALIVSLPVVAFVYGALPSARSFWGGVSGTVLGAAVLFALMRFGRDRGARLQKHLYKLWGGTPTTIMLRHRDQSLDPYTKERYKRTLARLSGLTFPSEPEELAHPKEADDIYDSAVRNLLEHRRRQSDKLVFNENCNYGFVRNLVGLKRVGLVIVSLALGADIFLYLRHAAAPSGLLVSGLVSLLTGVMLLLSTRATVRRTGDAYAMALLRTCEMIRGRSTALQYSEGKKSNELS
jgi:hypothetical protein